MMDVVCARVRVCARVCECKLLACSMIVNDEGARHCEEWRVIVMSHCEEFSLSLLFVDNNLNLVRCHQISSAM